MKNKILLGTACTVLSLQTLCGAAAFPANLDALQANHVTYEHVVGQEFHTDLGGFVAGVHDDNERMLMLDDGFENHMAVSWRNLDPIIQQQVPHMAATPLFGGSAYPLPMLADPRVPPPVLN